MRASPRSTKALSAFAVLALAGVAGAAAEAPPAVAPARASGLPALSDALRDVAARVGPTVVEISASGFVPSSARGVAMLAPQRGVGSGVVVSAEGYVVTNAHVVTGARQVQALLRSVEAGTSILPPPGEVVPASVVGVDEETDLAVLRIERPGLRAIELGDSDELRAGDLVLAFGSPLGLEQSVTLGIVSAPARQLSPEAPMIYVQTDAPINPGNSGGPLVDARGRLVGINTLIASQSGGSEGVGFAAPVNIVRSVYEQIRASGRVRRGDVGARAQTITRALAEGLSLPRASGVLVRDVVPGGPAEAAGLAIGDVVLRVDDKPVDNARQFQVVLYRKPIGEGVILDVLRGKEALRCVAVVRERPGDPASLAQLVAAGDPVVAPLGVLALDLDPRLVPLLPRLRAQAGVVVAAGSASSAFSDDALQAGDVIYTLDGQSVTSVASLRERLRARDAARPIVLQVEREGELRFVAVEASGAPEAVR
ncbi:MAG: trypsin-like peptidase domain-containing protein [Vicinamibacteria bacterium]